MPITLTNAILFHLDPIKIESGGIRIEGPTIVAAGPTVQSQPGDTVIDCEGAIVLPGLVNGHTHLYSALATGMPMPEKQPKNFHEILKFIWWRLDRALDAESIEMSARVGALDALACGTTTLIDHHASPNCIEGSLDLIEKGIRDIGLRAVLCYETTDRNGLTGFEAGLAENRRYLDKCKTRTDGRFGALVGAHAAFTLSDVSLRACVDLAEQFETGIHIHVAEDPCDDAICRAEYGAPLLDRLRNCGFIASDLVAASNEPSAVESTAGVAPANSRCHPDAATPANTLISRSILGHGTHLAPADAASLSSLAAGIAHNPRSNMNNVVGYAPIPHMSRVLLGTDGIGGDMITEAKTAWFKYRDSQYKRSVEPEDAKRAGSVSARSAAEKTATNAENATGVTPGRILDMLAQNARVASAILNRTLGKLEPGAAADIVITNYIPTTPLNAGNASAHFIFGMGAHNTHDVLIGGEMKFTSHGARRMPREIRGMAAISTAELWKRMQDIGYDD
ncbi:MAG: amidohydrolase family protein [Planctomycetes bacterium]|nr:amidohydrolase family protein [Planctomycetota bacterium]